MKEFFLRHLIRRAWFFPLVLAWGYFALKQAGEIKGYSALAFIQGYEFSLIIPAFLVTVSILSSKAEIEFCRCYGFGLPRLCMAQTLPYVIYTMAASVIFLLIFPVGEMDMSAEMMAIMFLSFFINLIAAVSLSVFVRVLTRSMFGCIGFEMIVLFLISAGKGEGWNYYIELEAYCNMLEKKYSYATFMTNRGIYLLMIAFAVTGSYLIMKSRNYTEVE